MCRDFVPRHPVVVVRFAVVLNGLGAVLGILGAFSIRFPPEGWSKSPGYSLVSPQGISGGWSGAISFQSSGSTPASLAGQIGIHPLTY